MWYCHKARQAWICYNSFWLSSCFCMSMCFGTKQASQSLNYVCYRDELAADTSAILKPWLTMHVNCWDGIIATQVHMHRLDTAACLYHLSFICSCAFFPVCWPLTSTGSRLQDERGWHLFAQQKQNYRLSLNTSMYFADEPGTIPYKAFWWYLNSANTVLIHSTFYHVQQ